MMLVCPRCGDYYADVLFAFCLTDGAPLVSVDAGSERWSEGARVIEEKKNALKKQKRRRKWRRILSVLTMLIVTMAVYGAATKRYIYLVPAASQSPTPTSSPTPLATPTATLTPTSTPTPTTPTATTIANLTPASTASRTPVYQISGRVTNNGRPLSGVNIKIGGPKTASTTTDANGNYAFGSLPRGGSYTIMPEKSDVEFTPRNRPIRNLARDESADFSGLSQPKVYKISGRVTEAATAKALSGVNITLTGAQTASTTTDANGNYAFGGVPKGGSYTITPRSGKINFLPSNRPINNLTRDESADFSGLVQSNLYKISGRVMDATKPLGGVNIKHGGSRNASTTTDANGYYRFGDLPAGGNYTITPEEARMNFTPRVRSVRNLTRDESADFSRPAPAPECSAADESREEQTIRRFTPEWRRNIQGERAKIIAENVPDGAAHTEAVLGEIEFQVTFLIPCKSAAITARYAWQVSYSLNGAQSKPKIVSRRRNIGCAKVFGMWVCR